MMRSLAAALAFGAAFAGGAACADTLEALYGNTLVVTYPSGNAERFHVDEGGSFTMIMSTGQSVEAQWRVEDDQFCVEAEGAPPGCSPMPMDKAVGDAWEQETPQGVVRYEIIAGR